MKKLLLILFIFSGLSACATNYTWSSANGNVLINRTNYPLLHAGDTVFIPAKSGGYRSFSMANLNSGAPQTYITIIWQTGAFIAPSLSVIFANSIDSIYGVHVKGFTMNDNIDVAFSSYTGGANYSKYVWFDSCTFRGMNGFFPSGFHSLSLPAFTGDSTNCFYKWRWSYCTWDSIVGANSGQSALNIGMITSSKNQFWVDVEIDHCLYAHYSSSANPANYIAGACVFAFKIHHNRFNSLGNHGPNYVGHAAVIFVDACQYFIWDNDYSDNFGNGVRSIGQGSLTTWFTGMPGSSGESVFMGNLDSASIKYPFIETQEDAGDDAVLSPYYLHKANPYILNLTMNRCGMGIGHQYYSNSAVDDYNPATVVHMYNVDWIGPSDTACCFSTAQGTNAILTMPNGIASPIDTLNNKFVQTWAAGGLADSTSWMPKAGGICQGTGHIPPTWITNAFPLDMKGNPWIESGGTISIGAFAFVSGSPVNSCNCIIIRRGGKIHFH
jgi:hypothetical protein